MTQRNRGHRFQIVDSEGYEMTEVDDFVRGVGKKIPIKLQSFVAFYRGLRSEQKLEVLKELDSFMDMWS